MRKLMWFTLGFAACCAAAAYGMIYRWLPPAAAAGLVLAVAAVCVAGRRAWLRAALTVLIGCLAGVLWFGGFYLIRLQPLCSLEGVQVPLSVTASDFSYETGYGTGLEGYADIDGKQYRVRVYLDEEIILSPGDRMEGVFQLRLTVPDDNTDSTYYQGNGIFLFAYQKEEIAVHTADQIPVRYFPAQLRQKILTCLDEAFPEDMVSFAKALLLGDTNELDYETDTAFKISGIRHIVAVSGLHVSILYSLICTLTGRKRFLSALAGIPVLLLFAAVAGFTPSVNRACVMVCLMMLSQLFDREYDPATALSFAVLVMLVANPMAVTSVSLQLSSLCVAGILLFQKRISSWLQRKLPKRKGIPGKLQGLFCGSVSVTVGSMSLVTPLSAAYFGTVSLVSIMTNLLTLWAVSLVFSGMAAVCLLHLISPALSAGLAGILSWLIRYVILTAKTLASIPLAAVFTESLFVVGWLISVYLLLAVFCLKKNRKPGIYIGLGTIGLCAALLLSWILPVTASTRITMLDVGQGQAILLQSQGKTFLVDCGGDSDEDTADAVAETLLSQGISRLDGVILTHYDRDHTGGLSHLLTRVDTDLLFLPDTRNEYEIPQTEGAVIHVWEDLQLTFSDATLHIYGPVYSGLDNENSLCVLFDTQKCDILITGDRSAFGERMLLRRRELPDVDILVAGHHGAADAVCDELLREVKPETVLISVAQDNKYGHPSETVLQRLEQFGCQVRRTDLEGTIIIRR